MGGNAFVQYGKQTVRMSTEQIPQVIETLYKTLPILLQYRPYIVKSVLEKKDHGDIDIVVDKGEDGFTKVFNDIKKSNILYFKNGSVISLLLEDKYQVDLIFTKTKYYEYSCQYYNFNDLGNLLGRLAKPHNIKHGHDGFGYIYYYNNDKSIRNDIYIGNSYADFLNLIEVKLYDDSHQFKTYKEVFDYVISSPYFNSKLYLFENLNNTNRVRDKKRKTYSMFLKYIKDIPPKEKTYIDVTSKYPFIDSEIEKINIDVEFKNKLRSCIDIEYVKNKFNTTDGKIIGKVLGHIRHHFTSDEMIDDFKSCVDQTVDKLIV